ncbi:hypothetical protein TNCV_1736571, partial [Trichonephila clavipes]
EFCLPNGQAFVAYPHRPLTLHSPTENSLAVLNHKILEANSHGPKREIRAVTKRVFQQIDCGTSCVDMLRRLVGVSQLLNIMIVQFRNEKVSNHGCIPFTIDCNVVAFIVFEEGFHQPLKRTKQSVFLDVTMFRHTPGD